MEFLNLLFLISIHALLAESDRLDLFGWLRVLISIHALLAESDRHKTPKLIFNVNFYPRSPCGERQEFTTDEVLTNEISIHALLAESDSILDYFSAVMRQFLSTLSLRRATSDR